jgi:2-oxoisovalerate dehydrogenase E1 component beta subunit
MSQMAYRDAIALAIREEMDKDPDVFLLGEDVGKFGGAMAATRGLWDKFGC